jgi:hypothetical protein
MLGSYRWIPRDVRRAGAEECERVVLEHTETERSFAVDAADGGSDTGCRRPRHFSRFEAENV